MIVDRVIEQRKLADWREYSESAELPALLALTNLDSIDSFDHIASILQYHAYASDIQPMVQSD
jgi:hypothetical protein